MVHTKAMSRAVSAVLQNDLGVDEAAAETILHLRSQVIELQSRIRQLEAELTAQYASQQYASGSLP